MKKYIFVLKSEAIVIYREIHNSHPLLSSPDTMIEVIEMIEKKNPGYEFVDFIQDGREYFLLKKKTLQRVKK